jgi:hypothetical protein
MWHNIVERGRSEITYIIRRMRIARWITKATKYTLRMCSTSGAYALAFSIDREHFQDNDARICQRAFPRVRKHNIKFVFILATDVKRIIIYIS